MAPSSPPSRISVSLTYLPALPSQQPLPRCTWDVTPSPLTCRWPGSPTPHARPAWLRGGWEKWKHSSLHYQKEFYSDWSEQYEETLQSPGGGWKVSYIHRAALQSVLWEGSTLIRGRKLPCNLINIKNSFPLNIRKKDGSIEKEKGSDSKSG